MIGLKCDFTEKDVNCSSFDRGQSVLAQLKEMVYVIHFVCLALGKFRLFGAEAGLWAMLSLRRTQKTRDFHPGRVTLLVGTWSGAPRGFGFNIYLFMTCYQDGSLSTDNHLKTFEDTAGDSKRCPKLPAVIISKILPFCLTSFLFRDFRSKFQVKMLLHMVTRVKNME